MFDLDETLYTSTITPWVLCKNTNGKEYWDIQDEFYNTLYVDSKLCVELSTLSTAYLFTNATEKHMDKCMSILKCSQYFVGMVCSDELNDTWKPMKEAFETAILKFNLPATEQVYFFEDSPINLRSAKEHFGWVTILIDKNFRSTNIYSSLIDYVFKDIVTAIREIKKQH